MAWFNALDMRSLYLTLAEPLLQDALARSASGMRHACKFLSCGCATFLIAGVLSSSEHRLIVQRDVSFSRSSSRGTVSQLVEQVLVWLRSPQTSDELGGHSCCRSRCDGRNRRRPMACRSVARRLSDRERRNGSDCCSTCPSVANMSIAEGGQSDAAEAMLPSSDLPMASPGPNIWTAASDGEFARVKELIESERFVPTSADENGYTPVAAAASWGHNELLKWLLTVDGSAANVADEDGDTPLHHVACASELSEEQLRAVTSTLLAHGGDPLLRNNEGKTCTEICVETAWSERLKSQQEGKQEEEINLSFIQVLDEHGYKVELLPPETENETEQEGELDNSSTIEETRAA
eukprot:gnl/TRDRNA2_/TRDRNA2_128740_c0_seq2.p1 gnl/TRDRNA2_/TRDRNA2_128740_c0~~gnl/TRDRNA2_/TRDRNA2_128740_c0_seq2.p1  ORF type:complete len:350 (+),score=61.49 gnl/TRDRNA2_/TRDRNA2_128740_c0_seq2:20-1069(+)